MARKKLNTSILSIRMDSTDRPAFGIYMGLKMMLKEDGSPVVGSFGQPLGTIGLKDAKSGEEFSYWADGGIRGALKISKVTEGQNIEIVHTGQKKIEDGTVQTYDIYENE